ncbi:MAG: AAA family ATPase [Planctomycetota bacterium]|nr:AAA family ATPase [Planctomycetota bacterium]
MVTTTDGAGGRAEYCAVGLGVHTTPGEFGGSGEDVVGVELSSLCSKTLMQVSSSGELLLPAGATVDPKVVLIGVGTVHAVRDHEASYSVAAEAGTQVQSELLALCAVLRRATKDIRILKKDNDFILHTIDQDGACPFYLAGDGLRRLFDIACRLAVARGGLVLVEEPECFQHPKAMDEFTRLLWAAIGQGTQVVFSTHSLELLAKVFEAGEGRDLSKACIMRTRLEDGVLTTLNIEGRNASERLTDVGEDLRR